MTVPSVTVTGPVTFPVQRAAGTVAITIRCVGPRNTVLRDSDSGLIGETSVFTDPSGDFRVEVATNADIDAASGVTGTFWEFDFGRQHQTWNAQFGAGDAGKTVVIADGVYTEGIGDPPPSWRVGGNLPAGGDPGQVPAKVTGADWDVEWVNQTGGGGGGGVVSVNGDTGPAVVLDAGDVGADPVGSATSAVSGIPSDGAAGTASLRTLGAGATQAAAGNDARLSDDRTPNAHGASHGPGGADPVTLAAGDVTYVSPGGDTDAQTVLDYFGQILTDPNNGLGTKLANYANLSDVLDVADARDNLGLGDAAVLDVGTTPGTVAAGDDPRFTQVPSNVQTGNYTLQLTDAGGAVDVFNSSPVTVTVPLVAFPAGTVIEIAQAGTGTVTVASASGVTIGSLGGLTDLAGQGATVRLRYVGADTWLLAGALA